MLSNYFTTLLIFNIYMWLFFCNIKKNLLIIVRSLNSAFSAYLAVWHLKKKWFYLFLERGEGRQKKTDRNIDVRGKHRSVVPSMCPDQGLNPQPRRVPWPGIAPATFCFVGQHSSNWATLVKAAAWHFLIHPGRVSEELKHWPTESAFLPWTRSIGLCFTSQPAGIMSR